MKLTCYETLRVAVAFAALIVQILQLLKKRK